MTTVSYHKTVNALQAMNFVPMGPFARAEWLALVEERAEKVLIATAEKDGRQVALCFADHDDRLDALTNWYSFTWAPHGDDAELLAELARRLRRGRSRIVMAPVPGESGDSTRLERAFRASGWHVERTQCDHNHVLEVGDRNFADYWATRPGQMRTTLKRKAKKVEVAILTDFDAVAWTDYEAIYAESWKPEEGDPVLLRRFAEAEAAAGRMRLGIARHAGEPVAAQFWTVEDGTAYIHKLAHLEAMKHLSAGTTLSAALFERVIDVDQVALIDFGTGNDPYKRDWMELDRPRYRIDCLNPGNPRAWPALVKRLVRRLAASKTGG
ncbi:GNAT family N-acetyltransferase [Parerythrobacter lacustris]|uniref:GNAT family N-acetyltransferase n=1 Tax=Parerythrobacter lacustris TaxID=2969984 RepID=A0ABT1XPU9_9SPHN|nr:GNAT family N-acetyltransferase [Parerythrobacter lacustris]